MRATGAMLVLLGVLIVALPHIRSSSPAEAGEYHSQFVEESAFPNNWTDVPPVYGWIVLVSGLLMIASTGRRDLYDWVERNRPSTDIAPEAIPS
jgi:hypothetical protein